MASPAKAGTGSRGGGMALWKIGRGMFIALCVFWQIFLLAPIVVIVVVFGRVFLILGKFGSVIVN